MTCATALLPASSRWMPLIVSGFAASAYSFFVGAKRSTNGILLAAATSAMAAAYICRRSLLALPSGRWADFKSSWAMGEKRTRRALLRPLYFCEVVCLTNASRSFLNAGSPALPANDSL